MMPIPGYGAVVCAWLRIEDQRFVLHGFLLYTLRDHPFPEYMSGSGLADLDGWTGRDCAVFVLSPPSQAWIDYTSHSAHPWWCVFGNSDQSKQQHLKETLGDLAAVPFEFNGEERTLGSILSPPINEYAYKDEVVRILERFGCSSTEHPSLLLFKNLRDKTFWFVSLDDMLGQTLIDLRAGLKRWFGSRTFADILEDARRA